MAAQDDAMLMMSLIPVAQQACVVPPELASFARPGPLRAGGTLMPGRAVRVQLAKDAVLPIVPRRAAAAGSYGGSHRLVVTRAGRYRVAVDGPVWIEVARGAGPPIASVAHGHAPACSGARKTVDYDLAAGIYTVQLSGAAAPAATLLIAGL